LPPAELEKFDAEQTFEPQLGSGNVAPGKAKLFTPAQIRRT